MQRLIDALATTEHRTIVSMGPLKDQMKLGPNMYGDQFLPQPSILPQCDLLITHGGNNTTCEGFHYGLPMIGLPLFWDQYDNAQRLGETGFGVRLPTYDWEVDQLTGAVDGLLADEDLAARMRATPRRSAPTPAGSRARTCWRIWLCRERPEECRESDGGRPIGRPPMTLSSGIATRRGNVVGDLVVVDGRAVFRVDERLDRMCSVGDPRRTLGEGSRSERAIRHGAKERARRLAQVRARRSACRSPTGCHQWIPGPARAAPPHRRRSSFPGRRS